MSSIAGSRSGLCGFVGLFLPPMPRGCCNAGIQVGLPVQQARELAAAVVAVPQHEHVAVALGGAEVKALGVPSAPQGCIRLAHHLPVDQDAGNVQLDVVCKRV